ncbi:MAG: phenylacetate--CoA ligase [Planctomycetaceae bacterium]|nr:phenylacetate--CoA ligase [Planctomycetaceae bacterium]
MTIKNLLAILTLSFFTIQIQQQLTKMSKEPFNKTILNPNETLTRGELENLQLRHLRDCVRRLADVPFYKQKFAEHGVNHESIRSLNDISRLPLTTKADLRNGYPLGFLAVPREVVARFHGSSGTTGKPTIVAYTPDDLKLWSELCARFLVSGGLQSRHTVQIAFGYGLFTGGFGLHYGVERVGAAVIPAAAGNTRRQLMLMQDMQTDVLVCTPSYALTIADVLRNDNIDPASLTLKYAHLGGETWTEQMRETIESSLGILAFNNYGLSEVIGPGVSGECIERTGMHIQEDHFLVECLDPETLKPVPNGKPGELVITAMTKQAMPILRYRTRDIAVLYDDECPCGRTTRRMSRVIGRSDDMMIIRGVNVFPSQIEEALLRVEGAAPHYQIELTRPGTLDEVRVKVEVVPEKFSDKLADMASLKRRIEQEVTTITGLHITIDLLPPKSIDRFEGKAKRVIDLRGMKVEV